MEKEDIQAYLQELGDELDRKKCKEPVRILLIGGAFMLITVQNRQFTEDIDFFPINMGLSTEPSKETKQFQSAARVVMKRHGLPKGWINDVSATMLGGLGPDPELVLWATFNKLEVYFPKDLTYILAMPAMPSTKAR